MTPVSFVSIGEGYRSHKRFADCFMMLTMKETESYQVCRLSIASLNASRRHLQFIFYFFSDYDRVDRTKQSVTALISKNDEINII